MLLRVDCRYSSKRGRRHYDRRHVMYVEQIDEAAIGRRPNVRRALKPDQHTRKTACGSELARRPCIDYIVPEIEIVNIGQRRVRRWNSISPGNRIGDDRFNAADRIRELAVEVIGVFLE